MVVQIASNPGSDKPWVGLEIMVIAIGGGGLIASAEVVIEVHIHRTGTFPLNGFKLTSL